MATRRRRPAHTPRILGRSISAALGLLAVAGPAAASPATGPVAALPLTVAPAAGVLASDARDADVPGPAQTAPAGRRTSTVPVEPTRSSSISTRTGGDASGAFYQAERAISVGQMVSSASTCTATVVTSNTGAVAVTAAHCVYWPATGPMAGTFATHGWVDLDQFIPGRTGDSAPYGTWHIQRAWIDPRWRDTGDIAYDVAFLQISPLQGRNIQDVVGSQGFTFTPPAAGAAITALGYPVEAPFDGRTLRRCSTPAITVDGRSENALTMPCAMTPGSSGGPWMTGFSAATGAGTVAAVTSFHDEAGHLWGRPLSDVGYALYQSADQANAG